MSFTVVQKKKTTKTEPYLWIFLNKKRLFSSLPDFGGDI